MKSITGSASADAELEEWLAVRRRNAGLKSASKSQIESPEREVSKKNDEYVFRGGVNNERGQGFEKEILEACQIYEATGVAKVDKTPEPFRVMKKAENGVFMGRFGSHAQPDFQGTLKGGKSIVFEAKYSTKDRILQSVLTDVQTKTLDEHYSMDAYCGVCIGIGNEYFFVPWEVWSGMKKLFGRKYLTPSDIEKYKIPYDGIVWFLNTEGSPVQSKTKK